MPGLILSVGNIKEPLGLDQITSDNDTLFTERALPTALTPGRNFGGAIGLDGDRWSLVGGIWGNDANIGIASNGVGATVRATFAPILSSNEVLHLGVAGSVRALSRDSMPTAFSSSPEDYLVPAMDDLVATGRIADATSVERLGLEAAYRIGSVRLQGEYTDAEVERRNRPALAFRGAYAQAAWVVNGEAPNYRIKPGYGASYAVFEGVEVADPQRVSQGGVGVFELAARVSTLDLQSGDIRGGRERDLSLGVNWYPDNNVKLMADYIDAHATPRSPSTPTAIDAQIFVGRLQLYW